MNLKKYLPFILFIFLCMLIYSKFGIIEVKASTYYVDKDFYIMSSGETINSYGPIPFKNFQYHTGSNKFDLFSLGFALKNLSLTYQNNFNNQYNYGLVENFSGYVGYYTLHFKYYYDISDNDNFSFIKWLNSIDPYIIGNDFYFIQLYDSSIYTSIDENGIVAYDEFIILKSVNVNVNLNYNYWNLVNKTYDNMIYFYSYIPNNSNNYTSTNAPEIDKSYIELVDAFISDEGVLPTPISTIVENSDIHYSSPDLLPYEEQPDNSIFGIIKRIWNTIANFRIILLNLVKRIWLSAITPVAQFISNNFNSLFVPEENFFSDRYNTIKSLFEEKFGLLIFPIQVLQNLVDRFNLLSSNDVNDFTIHIPEFTLPGYDVPLIQDTSYDLHTVLNNSTINTIWILYLDFIDVFMIISVLNLSWNKLNSIIGGQIVDTDYYTESETTTINPSTDEVIRQRKYITNQNQKRRGRRI